MTPTSFCQLVEGRLGWAPNVSAQTPNWQRYRVEARKVARKLDEDPARFTWRNLRLAVELLRRRQLTRTPCGVFAYVDLALQKANTLPDDTEAAVTRVMHAELAVGDPDGWAARLMRARGRYRLEVLEEWHAR